MKGLLMGLIMSIASVSVIGQTLAPQRLVAQSRHSRQFNDSVFLFRDSTQYFYFDSLGGSRFNYSTLSYVDRPADFLTLTIPTNNIDSQDYLLIHFDTSVYFNHLPNGLGEGRHYNPDGSIFTVNKGIKRTISIYSGGLLSKIYFVSNVTKGDTTAVRSFEYDNLGRMILDSMADYFGAVNRFTYTYNGNDRGCRTMLMEGFNIGVEKHLRVTNSYYPDGRVRTSIRESQQMGNSPLSVYCIDSFGYTPGVPDHTYWLRSLQWNPGTGSKVEANRFNVFGRPDSVTKSFLRNGVWEPAEGWASRYDNGGYPVIRYTYKSDNTPTGLTKDPLEVDYYYYNKQIGVAVKSHVSPQIEVALYPNPTLGMIHLQSSGIEVGTPISILISTLNGQPVHAEKMTWGIGEQRLILGSEAPAGTYLIRIQDNRGKVLNCQLFIRQ